jgi:uncharacterized protein (TIGR03067 family)
MMKFATPLAFAALILVGMQARVEEKATTEKNAAPKLAGDYEIVSGEKFGEKIPDERIAGAKVHFTENEVTVEDKDHKSTPYIASYTLDASKKPCVITMTSMTGVHKGQPVQGLVEVNGDQVRLVYALPGGETPKEFKTRANQLLFVMNAVKK